MNDGSEEQELIRLGLLKPGPADGYRVEADGNGTHVRH